MGFVHLHNHTMHSALDGLQQMDEMVAAAVADGQKAIAITDHGSLAGTWDFTRECMKQGVKPILGVEAYLAIADETRDERNRFDPKTIEVPASDDFDGSDATDDGATRKKSYEHLTMLAATAQGWKNLVTMCNDADQNSFKRKPLLDYALMRRYSEGIIVGTGCLGGPIAGNLLRGNTEQAEAELLTLVEIFGATNVFVEVMYHGIPAEDAVIPGLVALAEKHGLLVVATNDCHYTHAEQDGVHDAWLCISQKRGAKTVLVSDENRFKFNGSGYHLRTADEMHAIFDTIPGCQNAVSNSMLIADMVEDNVLGEGRVRLPRFDTSVLHWKPVADIRPMAPVTVGDDGQWDFHDDSFAALYSLIRDGAAVRYGTPFSEELKTRLRHEVDVIKSKGFVDYFLTVWDVLEWAASDRGMPTPEYPRGEPGGKRPIVVGCGRGSGPGSVVAYCLGITAIDPLEHNLLFERFLDATRLDLPDFDSDFEAKRRDEVVRYVEHRWGVDNVALLGTWSMDWAKSAVKDIARVTDRSALAGKLTKLMVTAAMAEDSPLDVLLDPKHKDYGQANFAFQQEVATNPEAAELIEEAKAVEGVVKGVSIHACGVVIGDEPLNTLIPLRWNRTKTGNKNNATDHWVTMWEPNGCGESGFGLIKFDFLNIRTLDVVASALKMVERDTGERIDPNGLSFTDERAEKVWQMLAEGRTANVFQLAGEGMTALCMAVGPRSFSDLAALVALYRPGPMEAGMHEAYARRKRGAEEVSYDTYTRVPEEQAVIENVMGDTLGVLCVAKGEKVWSTSAGRYVPVEDIRVGDMVQGVDDVTGKHQSAKVSRAWKSGHKPVFKVKMSGGHSVRLTGNHPVLTARGWVNVEDLTTDDVVAAPYQLLEETVRPDTNIHEARLMGLLIGDGHIPAMAPISLINNDSDIVDAFVESLGSVAPHAEVIERTGTKAGTFVIKSNEVRGGGGGCKASTVRTLVRKWGVDGSHSRDKSIPDFMLEQSGDAAKTLVAALFDCDGGFTQGITYKTISEELSDGIRALLLKWGIATSVTSYRYDNPKGTSETAHHIQVLDRDKFAETVAPFMSSKTKVALLTPEIRSNKAGSMYPTATIELPKPSAREVHNMVRNKAYIGRDNLAKLANLTGDQRLEAAAHSRWVQVISVEPDGMSDVYDLTVDGVHSFITEGVVTHNCYQEQLMNLARLIADFSDKEVNMLRKAFSKKDAALMASLRDRWNEGGLSNFRRDWLDHGKDYSRDTDGNPLPIEAKVAFRQSTLDELWRTFEGSASYLFNASHSYVYGYNAYLTAWLKANFPVQFGAAVLSNVPRDAVEKRRRALTDLARDGIEVVSPSVNDSDMETTARDGKVVLGLSEITGVGSAAEWIIAERNEGGLFTSLADVATRVKLPQAEGSMVRNKKLPNPSLEGLIEAGALDEFGPRLGMMMVVRAPLVPVPDMEWGAVERAARQRMRINVHLGSSPLLAVHSQLAEWREVGGRGAKPIALQKIPMSDGSSVVTLGVVSSVTERNISTGKMLNVTVEGSNRSVDVKMWPKTYAQMDWTPTIGQVVGISGRTELSSVPGSDEDEEISEGELQRLTIMAYSIWTGPLTDPPVGSETFPSPVGGILPGAPQQPEVEVPSEPSERIFTLHIKHGRRYLNAFIETSTRNTVKAFFPGIEKWVNANNKELGATETFHNAEHDITLVVTVAEKTGDAQSLLSTNLLVRLCESLS